ncbi:MAG: tetratricopeptide repeat protein [Acidobacteria bacterium]|nr:tetratricopeptide repeat protein [Acidobacteriota bacterium]
MRALLAALAQRRVWVAVLLVSLCGVGVLVPAARDQNSVASVNAEEAVRRLQQLLADNPKLEQAYLELAEAYLGMGKPSQGTAVLEEGKKQLQESVPIAVRLAEAYASSARHLEAAGELHRAHQLKPDPVLRSNLAVAYYQAGLQAFEAEDWQRAKSLLLEAERWEPDSAPILHLLGLTHYQQKEFAEAIQHYQKALQLDPRRTGSLYDLGLAYIAARRYAEAIDALKEAAEHLPENAHVRMFLGRAYHENHQYERAQQEFEMALKTQPALPLANYHLGAAYFARARYDLAKKHLDREAELNASYPYSYYLLAVIAIHQERFSDAVRLAEKFLALQPNDVEGLYHLGKALWKLGDLERSYQALREALKADSDHVQSHYLLARVCLRLGKKEEARLELERVSTLNAEFRQKLEAALENSLPPGPPE